MRSKFKTLTKNILPQRVYRRARGFFYSIKPLPDFLIIGTQKGGTTSLFNYLNLHPKVFGSSPKETEFFSYNYSKGVTWYRRHFPLVSRIRSRAITGEASPGYLYLPYTAKRIASILPDVKLIILLRNPVDRAISHYWHEVRGEREQVSMEDAFKKEGMRLKKGNKKILSSNIEYSFEHIYHSYLDRGKYAEQIERYYRYFNRDKVLILKSEDLFQEPQLIVNKTIQFLGLSPCNFKGLKTYNPGTYLNKTKESVRRELEEYFQPYNEQLYELLNIDFEW